MSTVFIRSCVYCQSLLNLVLDIGCHCCGLFCGYHISLNQLYQRLFNQFCRVERSRKRVRLILRINLCAKLIAGSKRKRALMEGQAYDGCKAPAFLVYVKRQTCEIAYRRVIRLDVSTIVAVVIVNTHAYSCSKAVGNLIAEVYLSAINILFSLHAGVKLIRRDNRGESVCCSIQPLC